MLLSTALTVASPDDGSVEDVKLDDDIGKSRDGSRTDDEAVQRYVTGTDFFFILDACWRMRSGCTVDNTRDDDLWLTLHCLSKRTCN